MVRNDPTKHRHGGISARLWLTACILIPPLLMAAGVPVFDSFAPRDPQPAAEQAPAPETIIAKTVSLAGRRDADSRFALANAEVHPGVTEQRPEQPTGSTRNAGGEQAAAVKDPARYYGPVPVAVVRVRRGGEQPEVADLDGTAPTVAPSKISHRLPAATRSFAAVHARARIVRHRPHAAYPVKPQHGAALSHKAPRPSIRTQRR
jgi:hypothetical protein